MDGIREYLIGVVAAALLCGCITAFVDAKSTTGAAIKLISALLMLLAVVRPWVSVSIDGFLDWAEDMGAEQKARVTYDNILRLSDDPDVNDVIKFLREREVVHFQRFGEAMELLRQKLNQKNVYYMNPAFDM